MGELEVHVVGGGVVGGAFARALADVGRNLQVVDTDPATRAALEADGLRALGEVAIGEAPAVVLLSVPTPAGVDGYDLTILKQASVSVGRALSEAAPGSVVGLRSTVPPGTLESVVGPILAEESGRSIGADIGICSMPEFLRQQSADHDARHPAITVIGGREAWARDLLRSVVSPLGGEILEFDDPGVAEAIKVFHNSFNAAKISFFNELHGLLGAAGIDPRPVSEAIVRTAEASWNPRYGIDGGRPFGGACLPKDLDGLIAWSRGVEAESPLLEAVRAVNEALATQAAGKPS